MTRDWRQASQSATQIIKKQRKTKIKNGHSPTWNNSEKNQATRNKHKEEDPTFIDKIAAKTKATKKKNHGDENYVNIEQRKKTNLEKYGFECALQNPAVKQKAIDSTIEHFGVDNVFKSSIIKEQVMQTLIDEYGVDNAFKSDEVKEKIKQTNLEKFGCENPMQNADVRKKAQQKYEYKAVHFDSAPEIAYYIWLTDNNIQFEYQPDVHFSYEADNKKHSYFPDFIVEGQFVELKGDQFFKEDGTMQNPYDHSQDIKYEAKHQCMVVNNVKILKSADYEKYLNYVDEKYGKDFLSKCKKNAMKSK